MTTNLKFHNAVRWDKVAEAPGQDPLNIPRHNTDELDGNAYEST